MLKLVKLSEEYKEQLFEMMEEWWKYTAETGEKIVPYTIRKNDYRDFEKYMNELEMGTNTEDTEIVPDSTFFLSGYRTKLFCRSFEYQTPFELVSVSEWRAYRRWCASVYETSGCCNKDDRTSTERMQKAWHYKSAHDLR